MNPPTPGSHISSARPARAPRVLSARSPARLPDVSPGVLRAGVLALTVVAGCCVGGCGTAEASPRLASEPASLRIELGSTITGEYDSWQAIDEAVAEAARAERFIVASVGELGDRFRTYELLSHTDAPGRLRLERSGDVLNASARLGRFGGEADASRLLDELRSAIR